MFLDVDERLFLMHIWVNPLTQESLNRFADVGIKTCQLHGYVSWDKVEPSPGVYDWSSVDRTIDAHRAAGFKMLVNLYGTAPDWLDGVIRRPAHANSGPYRAADPMNENAMAKEAEFLHLACERLSAADAICCYAMPGSGERVLPVNYGQPYTLQQCIDVVVRRQRIFAEYTDELWAAWHPGPAEGWTSVDGHTKEKVGNEYADECFAAMLDEFPDHTINRLVYTYFWGGASQWAPRPLGVKMWVGAEYCINVPGTAERMQPYGVWGLLMSHSNAWEDIRQPHDWEYENTAKALEILSKYHEKETQKDAE